MCFFLVHWQFILLPTKLTGTNIHWSLIIFGGPMKCASFQSSVMEPKAIVFPLKYFQLITFTITEYKQARRKGSSSKHSFTITARPSIDLRRSVLPRAK